MTALLFNLSAAESLVRGFVRETGVELGELSRRQFPDGESYVRLLTDVRGRDVVLLCTLDRPDTKALPLLYAAAAATDGGARNVGLVAPYLAYMRQDKVFHPGEAVTSRSFAGLLSDAFDWLITVDPHLHRYPSLGSVYSIPSRVVSATGYIAQWLSKNVQDPVLIGPDEESAQWVSRIAALAGAKSAVFRKTRMGDFDVSIDSAALDHLDGGTPVLIDDIASSARTLIQAVELVTQSGLKAPTCVVVHPIFAGDSYDSLLDAGVQQVVSTNTVSHESNAIDISSGLADAVRQTLESAGVSKGAGDGFPSPHAVKDSGESE